MIRLRSLPSGCKTRFCASSAVIVFFDFRPLRTHSTASADDRKAAISANSVRHSAADAPTGIQHGRTRSPAASARSTGSGQCARRASSLRGPSRGGERSWCSCKFIASARRRRCDVFELACAWRPGCYRGPGSSAQCWRRCLASDVVALVPVAHRDLRHSVRLLCMRTGTESVKPSINDLHIVRRTTLDPRHRPWSYRLARPWRNAGRGLSLYLLAFLAVCTIGQASVPACCWLAGPGLLADAASH